MATKHHYFNSNDNNKKNDQYWPILVLKFIDFWKEHAHNYKPASKCNHDSQSQVYLFNELHAWAIS